MNNIQNEFRVFKHAHHNGKEFIEQRELSCHPTNAEGQSSLQEIIKKSDDDFAHEDFFITKWELIIDHDGAKSWQENLKFGRQYSGFKKKGKGLLFTRKEYQEFQNSK
jgi:hypothetical protein